MILYLKMQDRQLPIIFKPQRSVSKLFYQVKQKLNDINYQFTMVLNGVNLQYHQYEFLEKFWIVGKRNYVYVISLPIAYKLYDPDNYDDMQTLYHKIQSDKEYDRFVRQLYESVIDID
ncbi:Hypothetical_protein [Hexamita inflata]|uniref:Hypothetical_protein n=1 Tax=Hexamita inflata TaxID=28002 RepID=A0AA86R9Q6_9EUKA|nr:Hypothetical protein HINF_LOCUS60980 [Hexamita inflata]